MAPSYKLHYFNVTGRAEPIRMILSYGGIPFEDIRYSKEEWPKIKPTTPLGQLPVLEIDDRKVTQGVPIARYLANIVGLGGKNYEECLEIDVVVEMVMDLLKGGYELHYEPDEERKKKLKEKLVDLMNVSLSALDKKAKENGGFLVLNRITMADIILLCTFEDLRNILQNKEILSDYPHLQQLIKHLLQLKNLKEYIQKRPAMPTITTDLKDDL